MIKVRANVTYVTRQIVPVEIKVGNTTDDSLIEELCIDAATQPAFEEYPRSTEAYAVIVEKSDQEFYFATFFEWLEKSPYTLVRHRCGGPLTVVDGLYADHSEFSVTLANGIDFLYDGDLPKVRKLPNGSFSIVGDEDFEFIFVEQVDVG